jgi:hypothetical protein
MFPQAARLPRFFHKKNVLQLKLFLLLLAQVSCVTQCSFVETAGVAMKRDGKKSRQFDTKTIDDMALAWGRWRRAWNSTGEYQI